MANLGSRGRHTGAYKQRVSQIGTQALFIKANVRGRVIVAGGIRMNSGQQNVSDGFTSQPCLEWNQGGHTRFRWTVTAGTRTVSIYVKNVGGLTPYPTLTIKANSDIGVNADVTTTGVAGTGWQQLTASCSPSSTGALWVEIYAGQNSNNPRPIRWDQFSTS